MANEPGGRPVPGEPPAAGGDFPRPVPRPSRQSWMPSGTSARPGARVKHEAPWTHRPATLPAVGNQDPPASEITPDRHAPAPEYATDPESDRGRSRRPRTIKIVVIAFVAIVAVAALAYFVRSVGNLSAGDELASNPSAYIPAAFDGAEVIEAPDIVANLNEGLLSATIPADAELISGVGASENELPPVIFVAARFPDAASAVESLGDNAAFGSAEPISIGGVDAVAASAEIGSGGSVLWTAVAAPRADVFVVAVVLTGGKDQARDALGAMLDAARK